LYLVGDIVDIWAMKNGVYWPEAHNQVVREVLDKAKRGTEVIYTPGNHDELFRTHLGADFGNVAVREEVIHTTADGRRFLVVHGDAFDAVVQNGKWLATIGSRAYDSLLMLDGLIGRIRRLLGLRYWSLAGYLKYKVKNAVSYIDDFEEAVANEAERRQVDGMICGHIHHAEIREIAGVDYCNCGDWVESCTALVEHHDGRLELLRWTDAYPQVARAPQGRFALARVG
jgi:UDP-2,3-diacylglucosamine pyrophosphatase LpxH